MASVSQLGYLGIGARDQGVWQDLASHVLGLEVVPGDDRSSFYLRMDEYHHRIEVRTDANEDLEFVGWEVPDPAALQQVAQQLEDAGVKVIHGTREEADRRRVIDLVKCADPDGTATEVFCGRPVNPQPFHPSRPMTGFKTGEMGMGHILVYVTNLEQTVHFYRDLLGFRVSDFTEVTAPGGKVRLAFLHCNPRHHSIALLEAAGAPKRINHIMMECNSLDDVGSARDLCLERGIPIAIDLGRHMNDHVVSFYMANPSNFAIEYGWGGRTIDDRTWQVEHYTAADSLWGHPQLRDMVSRAAPR